MGGVTTKIALVVALRDVCGNILKLREGTMVGYTGDSKFGTEYEKFARESTIPFLALPALVYLDPLRFCQYRVIFHIPYPYCICFGFYSHFVC